MTVLDQGPPLFRDEVLARNAAPAGAILLARPASFAMLTTLAALIVVCLLAFFIFCSTSATARLPGVVTPQSGVLRVVADRDAFVAERHVSEGQTVKVGDALFLLRASLGDPQREDADSAVARLMAQRRDSLLADARHRRLQDEQRLLAARRRIDALRDDQRRLEGELALQTRRVELGAAAWDRQRQLQRAGMSTLTVAHDHEIASIDARQRLSQLEGALASSRRDQEAATRELRAAELQRHREEEGLLRALAVLDQEVAEHQARRETLIRAPADGRVSALQVASGQTVAARETLAQLWPEGSELEAELRAPSRAAAFMAEGMPVRLQLDAFPHQTFGAMTGRVRSVDLVTSGAEASYRVRVRLSRPALAARGVDHPLRPGMTLEAIVPLERRRLYEWVLDPIKRLAPAQPVLAP